MARKPVQNGKATLLQYFLYHSILASQTIQTLSSAIYISLPKLQQLTCSTLNRCHGYSSHFSSKKSRIYSLNFHESSYTGFLHVVSAGIGPGGRIPGSSCHGLVIRGGRGRRWGHIDPCCRVRRPCLPCCC